MKRVGLILGSSIVVLITVILLFDFLTVGKPVADELASDSRNVGFVIKAHQLYRVPLGTLVLDLREARDATPADLLRAVFQAAEVFEEGEKAFSQVILANRGDPVFLLDGQTFLEIGTQRRYGENPVYMMRKFPSKLVDPSGTPAYGEWTGGLIGVVGREMEDVNDAMRSWVAGGGSQW